jgi:hypothetical protein
MAPPDHATCTRYTVVRERRDLKQKVVAYGEIVVNHANNNVTTLILSE